MKPNKSPLELRSEELKMKRSELVAVEAIKAAKQADKTGKFSAMLEMRLKVSEHYLMRLDPLDNGFQVAYSRFQSVRDEYLLLLGLLADPEKRAEKVGNEVAALAKEVERLKKEAETKTLGQF